MSRQEHPSKSYHTNERAHTSHDDQLPNKKKSSKSSHYQKIKNTWLAPTLVFILICIVSLASYVAQSMSAENDRTAQEKQNARNAQIAIENTFQDIEVLARDAAKLYTNNTTEYEETIAALASERHLTSSYPSIVFIGFASSKDQTNVNSEQIDFLQPIRQNMTGTTSTASLVGTPISQMVNITTEINDTKTSGKPVLTRPFLHQELFEGNDTYILLLVPVYDDSTAAPTKDERIESYKGSIVIPIALNIFLDTAQKQSGEFRIFRLVDQDNNILASNTNINPKESNYSSTLAQLANKTIRFEFDNPELNTNDILTSQKSTLITGFGVGIIVFLLFAMMRVSENRARKFAENAEREIRESEARFSALIEQSSDITLVLDSYGKILFASPSIWFALGYSPHEISGKKIFSIIKDRQALRHAIQSIKRLNTGVVAPPFEASILSRDGQQKIFECVINDLRKDPAVQGIVCNSRDVTERKHAEANASKAQALYENALNNAPIGVALIHRDGEIFFTNDALHKFLGLIQNDMKNIHLQNVIVVDDQFAFSELWSTLESQSTDKVTKELRFYHPDGRQRWGLISAQGVYDEGEFQYYVVQIEDTTERRSIAERLEYQAIHDPLTGLPNRILFVDRLEVALQRAKRTRLGVAVLFLDLDRFKIVNDSLGHAAGDRLLVAVAERIKASVRPNDTLARFGGDEFVILCEDITDESQVHEISERLLTSINRPIMLIEGEVYVTASIGIARSLTGEDTSDTILRDADTAMYRAKDSGRNRSEVFDERTHTRAVQNLEIGNAIFRALEEQEFRVHYQPIISLASGRLSGFEALAYWQHPERGHVGPNEFIGLAEETGLIVPLGSQILEQACVDLVRWHSMSPQAEHLKMSINISPRQLAESSFVHEVEDILQRTGVNPSRVWFEITESALMVDADSTIAMLEQLRNLGVHFEVDDFGTGYSSMSYLKKFPVDALKIDQSFVDGLGSDPEDTAIVTAVISLSHALGLQAIAEGVETPVQMAELKTLGCEYAQGYLFARPGHPEQWDEAVQSNELFTFAKIDE